MGVVPGAMTLDSGLARTDARTRPMDLQEAAKTSLGSWVKSRVPVIQNLTVYF